MQLQTYTVCPWPGQRRNVYAVVNTYYIGGIAHVSTSHPHFVKESMGERGCNYMSAELPDATNFRPGAVSIYPSIDLICMTYLSIYISIRLANLTYSTVIYLSNLVEPNLSIWICASWDGVATEELQGLPAALGPRRVLAVRDANSLPRGAGFWYFFLALHGSFRK